jgi:RND superfamily putative drug exporter
VRRSPILFLLLSLAVLIALASPILSMRLGSADAGNNPESATTRRAYDLLTEGFGPGFNGPILIAFEIDDANARSLVETLPGQIEQIEGVAFSSQPLFNEDADAAILTVIPTSSPQDEKTGELVDRLREFMPRATSGSGARAFVGGQTAAFIDVAQKISDGMPIFFLAVIGLSVLLLAVVFRSLIVPLKAALMILLSVGVGFGVITALFQWGWLSVITGVDSTGPIESFLPMMLFAVLFGLSMDYEVFLVTRVHEEFLSTGDGRYAVERGQAVTFRVIIAAGLIMSSVFFSFALVDFRVIKEFGFGLGIAILADALIVRMVLVPSIMHLVGNNAWWFPSWLDRLLPRVSVEGDATRLQAAEAGND